MLTNAAAAVLPDRFVQAVLGFRRGKPIRSGPVIFADFSMALIGPEMVEGVLYAAPLSLWGQHSVQQGHGRVQYYPPPPKPVMKLGDGCLLQNMTHTQRFAMIPLVMRTNSFLVVTRWTSASNCTPFDVGRGAEMIGAYGVINVVEDGTTLTPDDPSLLRRPSDVTSDGREGTLRLPFVTVGADDGDAIFREMFEHRDDDEPPWARVLLTNPSGPYSQKMPQHMITMAMAAPLVIFSVLCAMRLMRRRSLEQQYLRARAANASTLAAVRCRTLLLCPGRAPP